jgi:hypothetical protein
MNCICHEHRPTCSCPDLPPHPLPRRSSDVFFAALAILAFGFAVYTAVFALAVFAL